MPKVFNPRELVKIRLGHAPKRPCKRPRQCDSALCCFPSTPRVTFSDLKWQLTRWKTKSQGRLVHVEMNFASTGFYMLFVSNYSDIPCLFTSCNCLNLSALGKVKSNNISKKTTPLLKYFSKLSWPI